MIASLTYIIAILHIIHHKHKVVWIYQYFARNLPSLNILSDSEKGAIISLHKNYRCLSTHTSGSGLSH